MASLEYGSGYSSEQLAKISERIYRAWLAESYFGYGDSLLTMRRKDQDRLNTLLRRRIDTMALTKKTALQEVRERLESVEKSIGYMNDAKAKVDSAMKPGAIFYQSSEPKMGPVKKANKPFYADVKIVPLVQGFIVAIGDNNYAVTDQFEVVDMITSYMKDPVGTAQNLYSRDQRFNRNKYRRNFISQLLYWWFRGLCFPDQFSALADWLEPPTNANAGTRFVDSALYWLAYLHFGRINGIGIPCHGPGVCDQATKAVWAIVGAIPAAMFVTGAIMWWNRVVRRWRRGTRRSA